MLSSRKPLESEFDKVIDFLDENLRSKEQWSINEEYPTVLNLDNLNNIRIIEDNESVLSHAAIKPLLIKSPFGLFKIAGIGSVVTAESHRKQGLSSAILNDCLASATEQGCEIAILWSDLFNFYRKLGFELAGSEVSFQVNQKVEVDEAATGSLRYMKTAQVSPDAFLNIYNQHTVTSLRTLPEVKSFLKIPNSKVYTAWNLDGTLAAYAIEGKGADLTGYVHEWGGKVTPLLGLFNFILEDRNSEPYTLIAPAHSQNLIRTLNGQELPSTQGFLGMIKILKPKQVLQKIQKYSRRNGIEGITLDHMDGVSYIGIGNTIYKTDSIIDLTQLIFGPKPPESLFNWSEEELTVLKSVFPIPMWIWGWDSV